MAPRAGDDATPVSRATGIVAAVVMHQGHVLMLRRSGEVAHEARLWQCLTGFIEQGADARAQLEVELREEVGYGPDEVTILAAAAPLEVTAIHRRWEIHPFLVLARDRRVQLNWEHDDHRWVPVQDVSMRSTAWWFPYVLRAVWPFSHDQIGDGGL